MARDILKSLPQELDRHVTGVTVCAETFPDTETGQNLDLENRFDLPGYAA
jgi:predicted Zn-dependent protease with MMP-like domain